MQHEQKARLLPTLKGQVSAAKRIDEDAFSSTLNSTLFGCFDCVVRRSSRLFSGEDILF